MLSARDGQIGPISPRQHASGIPTNPNSIPQFKTIRADTLEQIEKSSPLEFLPEELLRGEPRHAQLRITIPHTRVVESTRHTVPVVAHVHSPGRINKKKCEPLRASDYLQCRSVCCWPPGCPAAANRDVLVLKYLFSTGTQRVALRLLAPGELLAGISPAQSYRTYRS
jgi:hypothetical protein